MWQRSRTASETAAQSRRCRGQTSHAGPTGHEELGLSAERGSTLGELHVGEQLSVFRKRPGVAAGRKRRILHADRREARGNSGEGGGLSPSTELLIVL